MVEFKQSAGGFAVWVNEKPLGHIGEQGFFTSRATILEYIEVSSDDLRMIADIAEGFMRRKSRKIHSGDTYSVLSFPSDGLLYIGQVLD